MSVDVNINVAVPGIIVFGLGCLNTASLSVYKSPYVISVINPSLVVGKAIIGVFS